MTQTITATHLAYLITPVAEHLGDPEITITTQPEHDERYHDEDHGDAEVIERHGLDPERALMAYDMAYDELLISYGWRPVGAPDELERGHYSVDVVRV
jgi:hypothetical protein